MLGQRWRRKQNYSSEKHVRVIYTPLNPLLYRKTGVCRGLPIFSSPEPLGSQGELIGWP